MGLNKYFLKYSKCIQVMVSPFLISCFYIFSNGHRHSGLSNGHPPSPDLNYEMGDPLHEGKEEETWGPSSKAGMELRPLCSPELSPPELHPPELGTPELRPSELSPPELRPRGITCDRPRGYLMFQFFWFFFISIHSFFLIEIWPNCLGRLGMLTDNFYLLDLT